MICKTSMPRPGAMVMLPSELSPLVRNYLKEAFHAVASVQKRVASEIQWTM